jgi:hypothetical protein
VVDLMPKVNSNTVMMNYTIDERGTISGKLRKQQTDYNAMTFRKKWIMLQKTAILKVRE